MAAYCANCDSELERNDQGDLVCTTPGCVLEGDVLGDNKFDFDEEEYDG